MSIFSGGIVNAAGGVVSGAANAIAASGIAIFYGGITNRGKLVGGGAGIALSFVQTFAGAISNTGTISAGDGISFQLATVFGSSTAGGIVNGGTMLASNTGVLVKTPTFFGSIINSSAGKIIAARRSIPPAASSMSWSARRTPGR